MKKFIVRREVSDTTDDFNNLHPLLKKIYLARGIKSPADLNYELSGLIPFHTLLNINTAVRVIAEMLMQQKNIVVIGDFDVDGATSCCLAVSALQTFGGKHIDYLVPNRFEYGYGLTPEIVAVAALKKPDLIITVDNGISSIAGVEAANAMGIQVVITDHHLQGKELPKAAAIINPNQIGDQFPSKNLCGVGVIFYVMLALRTYLREQHWFAQNNLKEPNMAQFLDLVALGTVADVVTLDKNNRALVQQGLRIIRSGRCRAGIKALLDVAQRRIETITASSLGFAVAPRLNAAGRLDDMSLGVSCLLTQDYFAAKKMAVQLDQLNGERRVIEANMQQQAFAALSQLRVDDDKNLPLGVCFYDASWHQGVIGIVAGRMKDYLHRPVIAFAPAGNDEIKGSARSINGIHIRDAIEWVATQAPALISKFGGHAMAAGLSLPLNNYIEFSQLFNEAVTLQVGNKQLRNEIYSDGELASEHYSVPFAELIRDGGPWGQHFDEPLFDGRFRLVQQRIVGGKHLKCTLGTETSPQMLDAIAFNVDIDRWPNHRCQFVTSAYRLSINEFNGVKNVQLILETLEEG